VISIATASPIVAYMFATPLITAAAAALNGLAVNLASRDMRKRDDGFSYVYQLERRWPTARP
jgi:hypothetical protein